MPEKKKVILDTNFLLIPAQFGFDIFTELQRICDFNYELFIFDKSLDELERSAEKQKGAQKHLVKTAISLTETMKNNNKLNIIPAKTAYIDREILEAADKDTVVATQDKELRKKLRQRGIRTIIMKQGKYLAFEG